MDDRHGKYCRDAETAAAASSAGPELDELGLEPPPSNLLAPWAKKKPQPHEDDCGQKSLAPEPTEAKSTTDSIQIEAKPQSHGSTIPSSQKQPTEVSNENESRQSQRVAQRAPEQASHTSKQVLDTSDTTLDYILGNTLPRAGTASNASPSEKSPEQTERSSGLTRDSSLIQARSHLQACIPGKHDTLCHCNLGL